MTTEQPEINPNALRSLLTHAVAALQPAERTERMDWCRRHNHAVTMHADKGDRLAELRWGGRTLALVPLAELTNSDRPDEQPAVTVVAVFCL
jgi:hypothetical protein